MDFAIFKAYMSITSIKENVNTTDDCMQKRLSIYRLDRQISRNARLTQFRKIPENLSDCNTPQPIRNDPQLDVSNTKPLKNTSKLFEDKQKLRQKRLREFKEKKEKAKRDEANKKPIFKVTHACLEDYDLGKLYNNLSNTGPYKFKTLVTRASKHNLGKQLPEAISIIGSSDKNNKPINSYKLRSKKILTEANPLVYNKAKKQAVHSKGTLHHSVLSSDSYITKSKVKIITAEGLQTNCILPSNLSESILDINKSLAKASVKITKEEQMILDNNFISNASKKCKECSHVTQEKKNDSNMREETEKMLKSTRAKLPADNTKLKDVLDNKIVNNIENYINEGNADYEQGSFTKTSEHNNAGGNPEEKCVYISPFVTISRGKNIARKEYVQRMGSGGTFNSPGLQLSINIKTAAEYFTLLLDKETNKINKNCEYWNTFKNDNNLPEEAIDMIDVAIGQGNLLQNKKMQSFRNLIQYSLEEQMEKPVTCMNLHGYRDVLHIQIDNVSARFETFSKMRDNNWKEILPEKPKKNAPPKKGKALTNTKRSNDLQDAIKSARLRAKTLSNEISIKTQNFEIKPTKNSGTLKRISNLNCTPRNSLISPKSGSPHIMMQVSQVAKSVDRIGSEAVHSAKSALKKRQEFKATSRKPKVVLFDVTDDAVEDDPAIQKNILSEKEAPILRKSLRLQLQNVFI